jgi:hypothetical protein
MSQSGNSRDSGSQILGLSDRGGRRATSVSLLLLGSAAAVGVVPQLSSGMGDALAGLMMALAFAPIWLVLRLRVARVGVGRGIGLGAASMLGLLLVLAVVGLMELASGPFLIFGVGLFATALYQCNFFLAVWAIVIGGIGIFEAFFGITNRLPLPLWAAWEHSAIYLFLAFITVLAGIFSWLRENRESRAFARD